MVSKITLFEPHFHDSSFGPQMLGDHEDTHEEPEPESTQETSEDSGGMHPAIGVVASLVLLAIIGIAVNRLRGSSPDDTEETSGREEQIQVDAV